MSTTQVITLASPARPSTHSGQPHINPDSSIELPNWTSSTAPAVDTVIEASRLADAQVPDGGYGWVIVGACSLINFWFVGTTYSWGIMQDALIQDKLADASTLAWAGSLTVTCIAAFAMVNAKLVRTLGTRKMALLGISLMGIGQFLGGFAMSHVGALFVTEGVIMGYGVSCCFMTVSIAPAQYFNRNRGLANGLVYAGGGVGGAVISLSMSATIESFGVAWTFRLVGILMLVTGLPAAWLVTERAPIRRGAFVEWSLLKDLKFMVLFIAAAVATFPLFVPPFFLPLYARSIALNPNVGASLVAAFNLSSAVGRVLCGLLGDKMGPINTLLMSLVISAVSMLALWPISTSLASLVAFVVVNGMGNGGFFAIMPTVVGNVFGSARVSVAMGMMVTGWTGGYLLGAPIAGYILAAYGGEDGGFKAYRPAIFYAGSMALGAAGLVAFVRFRMSSSVMKRL